MLIHSSSLIAQSHSHLPMKIWFPFLNYASPTIVFIVLLVWEEYVTSESKVAGSMNGNA